MAITAIDILELYGTYFGYIGLPFLSAKQLPSDATGKDFEKAFIEKKEGYSGRTDFLGRPIFLPVEIGGIWFDIANLSLSASKNIVSTPIIGRQGTVKELISANDYKISFKGILVGDNEYPESGVEELFDLYNKNEAISIKSLLTDVFEVSKVVIETLNLPEPKHKNLQPFSMDLISDDDFTAILK